MKRISKISATLLFAAFALMACKKGGGDGGDGGKTGGFPPVDITSNVSGSFKAGVADVIEITGSGFDTYEDYIYVGFAGEGENEGKEVFEQIKGDAMTFTGTRISFGVNVGATFLSKTVKVYLERRGYDKMPISGDITFTLPTVSEGYIPDPTFRTWLSNPKTNAATASGFSPLGMLNPATAAAATELELGGCEAVSIEGIELFTSLTIFRGWDMKKLVEADFSKLTANNVDIRLERSTSLEKLITPPRAVTVVAWGCPKLTHVDAHNSPLLSRLEISEQKADAAISAVTMLDIRKNHTGVHNIYGGDSYFRVADNATVKIDSWFLKDHNVGTGCWTTIYEAWKNRGAKIEVYSRVDPHRDELLGTVPMASEDPEALSPNSHNGGVSSNKWTIEDPYVSAQ